MNPVLILTRNCLELTKKCVDSVQAQDIPVEVQLVDNGSSDGTREWANAANLALFGFMANGGVSFGWNFGLTLLFGQGADHVLVLNNDTVMPPWFYRSLLSCDAPFVTGVTCREMDAVMEYREPTITDGPDFSAFLIRRECWQKVGPFDESMVHYCSDVDYNFRARELGIMLHNSHVKFYHERSSTLNLASPEDRAAIQAQSNKDHEAFRAKYGGLPSDLNWKTYE